MLKEPTTYNIDIIQLCIIGMDGDNSKNIIQKNNTIKLCKYNSV